MRHGKMRRRETPSYDNAGVEAVDDRSGGRRGARRRGDRLCRASAPPSEARGSASSSSARTWLGQRSCWFSAAWHDYRIDQGKIVSVRQGTIELLERDGTRQLIPVSPIAQVLVNGRFATLASVPLRLNAITVRDGDEPRTPFA